MALTDYLTSHYLSADPPSTSTSSNPSKKRKRTHNPTSGLQINDDDISGFQNIAGVGDDDGPTTHHTRTAEFRKKKGSSFKPIASNDNDAPTPSANPAPTDTNHDNDPTSASADAIISATASHNHSLTQAPDDEAPALATDPSQEPTMSSGAGAGLQSASSVSKALRARERSDRLAAASAANDATAQTSETIYRDASGRIVNIAMKRAEARRALSEEARSKAAKKDALLAPAQRALKSQRADELASVRVQGVARYADDAELNAELKARERWDDPAAGFVEQKREGRSVSGRPLYKGGFEPNRYGIRPGHRWDGVDRGNGHEKVRFKAGNARRDRSNLAYAWEMDE
ncbi:MAG: Pre-mRNA-splicing factor cwc26 [Chrysothrix sp. TS-e1954]|nr:MAG: Pre-mRNA-splicing factor cwc26 [Chrysothrix sp. TS-e1954]